MNRKYHASGIVATVSTSLLLVVFMQFSVVAQTGRPRLRDMGVSVGILSVGKHNAITDVSGVKVGQVMVNRADSIRTGVTAIIPHSGNLFKEKIPGAIVVGNGFGKLVGMTQVEELGQIETPIVLTNTLSVWDAARTVARYMAAMPGNEGMRSVNPVVGETNDGGLNDIRAMAVKEEHVLEALRVAAGGPVMEGSVGAGRGTVCFGWKGGIGTSSRVLPTSLGGFTVGTLVQTNYGGVLDIAGVPIGKELGSYAFKRQVEGSDGSCMIVVATDAPVDAKQLKRIATRALLSLGRTGSAMYNGSGDYVIAFSTSEAMRITGTTLDTVPRLSMDAISPIFQATMEAVEEAIYNSLLKAETVTGVGGRTVEAINVEKVVEVLRRYGRIE